MIELAQMFLAGAISWGVNKSIDVLVECFQCGDLSKTRIANVHSNEMGCTNCWREYVQFTNACEFTVMPDKKIAHVGARFRGGYAVDVDPLDSRNLPGWIFFHTSLRALGLQGRQIVVKGELKDFGTDQLFTNHQFIYDALYYDTRWYENERLPLRWDSIPVECRDNRIFAIDLNILSRYGDLLFQERYLTHLV